METWPRLNFSSDRLKKQQQGIEPGPATTGSQGGLLIIYTTAAPLNLRYLDAPSDLIILQSSLKRVKNNTVDPEIFAIIIFSRIALKYIFATLKIAIKACFTYISKRQSDFGIL